MEQTTVSVTDMLK